jgi:hypothetical protein
MMRWAPMPSHLSGANAALFEIDGTELFLRAGTTLNFEGDPEL